jgi:tRNA threonylcarbamoyladenosine biosynthesis protein TsaB
MTNILAIDTATEACSVALRCEGIVTGRFELAARQHSQLLFPMLTEVLPGGAWKPGVVDVLAYAHGPGSFTGLRIAASAVQGLAYAGGLPVAGISTLACLAQGAWRRGALAPGDLALVVLDARINEVYWGLYELHDGIARALLDDAVCAPGDLPAMPADSARSLVAIGDGIASIDEWPKSIRASLSKTVPDQWPDSQDLLVLADAAVERGELVEAAQVQPVYLRNDIGWKKLAEQG